MTILVVDDNSDNLYQLQVLLPANGFDVITAANGAEALQKARDDPPDLIIADILMPVMDGFALCREWKRDERLRGIPFIFYTATYTDERDRQLALDLGAERFLVKPEEPEVLLRTVREVLAERQQTGAASSRPAVEEEAVYLKEYNQALIRKLEDKLAQLEATRSELEQGHSGAQRADLALRESETRYRRLHESMTDAFVLVDMSGRILETNRAYEKMLGYDTGELSQLTYQDLTPEQWHALEAQIVAAEVLPLGHSRVYEKELRRKDGTVFPVELRTFLLRGEAGEPAGMWGIVRDITERKKAAEELRLHTLLLSTQQEASIDGILVVGGARRDRVVQPAVRRDVGHSSRGDLSEERRAIVALQFGSGDGPHLVSRSRGVPLRAPEGDQPGRGLPERRADLRPLLGTHGRLGRPLLRPRVVLPGYYGAQAR